MVNGWSNRETWLVNLHFGDSFESINDIHGIKEYLEEAWNRADIEGKNFFNDFMNLELINWEEILEHYKPFEEE